ncbi:hypothetical protein ACFCYI_23820 [Streptomyces sp. NPDC056257]|uniref:hypothetical protein n=1 Tax=Streptomyces sp. NPDC056257 TaxID=3345765 RepID=UPI0035DDADA9
MAGLTLLGTLNQRDWPPVQRALGTLLLLYQPGGFQRIDDLVPGCQGDLLGTGSGPGPLRT